MELRFGYVKKGFTLVEMLVVVGIVGIIVAIILVSFSSSRQKARDAKRISDINQVRIALEQYYSVKKFYPDPDGVGEKGFCGLGTQAEFGKYLATLPKDPSDTTGLCNGTSPYYYDYYSGGTTNPQEVLLRVRTFELPSSIRQSLASDEDGLVAPKGQNPLFNWVGGSKIADPAYCNAPGGCATVDCGNAASDSIYCVQLY